MSYINWDQSFSVGVKTLDNQHKHLFAIINQLYDACESKQPISEIAVIFDQVLEYTMAHFGIEEQYMLRYKYDDYEEHKALHEALTSKAQEIAENIHAGDVDAILQAHDFLKKWLESHIKKVDLLYAEHIKQEKSLQNKIA